MKNTIISLLVLLIAINTALAQKIKEAEVAKAVLISFQANFKGAKVKKWEKESDGKYIAEFDWDKIKTSATFTFEGRLVKTERKMKAADLSKKINDYISQSYSGFKIRKATLITAGNGKKMYKAEIKKKKEKWNLVFDGDSNFIRNESTEPEEEEKD